VLISGFYFDYTTVILIGRLNRAIAFNLLQETVVHKIANEDKLFKKPMQDFNHANKRNLPGIDG
jgi:hypothetical protein